MRYLDHPAAFAEFVALDVAELVVAQVNLTLAMGIAAEI